eukprot:XP_022271409.1 toll-like receptor 10 isoform X2 [Canis lupus familiaris]
MPEDCNEFMQHVMPLACSRGQKSLSFTEKLDSNTPAASLALSMNPLHIYTCSSAGAATSPGDEETHGCRILRTLREEPDFKLFEHGTEIIEEVPPQKIQQLTMSFPHDLDRSLIYMDVCACLHSC